MADTKDEKAYLLDQHAEEGERLTLAQEVIVDSMGKAVWAPIDLSQSNLKILDSATAGGAWISDLEKTLSNSNNTYVGTDLRDALFPTSYSPNASYIVQDMLKPYPSEWASTFDLIHQRSALPAVGKDRSPEAIAGLIGLLKPGGWLQLVEPDHKIAEGPAARAFTQLLDEVFSANETHLDIAKHMETWLVEAGLQNVGAKIFDIPMGKKNPKEEMQSKSQRFNVLSLKGMIGVAKHLPVSFSQEELERLPADMEEELSTQGGVLRLYCVWGQRP